VTLAMFLGLALCACSGGDSEAASGGGGGGEVPVTGAARIFFSDLDSAPNAGGKDDKGAFVTIWGKNFGSSRGTSTVTVGGGAVDNYVSWSDTKIVFQLGASAATGNIVVTNSTGSPSNGVPFAVRAGAIYFVSPSGNGNGTFDAPMSPTAAYAAIAPGVTFYYRGGSYTGQYGQLGWGDNSYVLGASKKGTAGNPVAFVGYPGEVAAFSGRGTFGMRDSSETTPEYITIANLRMSCVTQCIGGGHITSAGAEVAKSGAKSVRLVGNVLSASYTWNTMTGLITIGNDGWRVYGNEIKDTGTTPAINNNHAIYVQVGASDVDIGWNYLHDLRMGHVIQIHTDTPFKYENVRVHDNVLSAATTTDSRGVGIGETLPGSYGSIYNNVFNKLGQGFSAIAIYSGDWNVFNNTFYGINSSSGIVWLNSDFAKPTANVRNNIFYSDGSSPYVGMLNGTTSSQLTLSNNLYFNRGSAPSWDSSPVVLNPLFVDAANGNFRLQATSPAIDKGTSTVTTIVTTDADGAARLQGSAVDIGAFEYKR
jgi:Domain of unknown function (DUF5123)/IPT/TIG domain